MMDFAEVDRRYNEARQRHSSGQITQQEFEYLIRQMAVRDSTGRLWAKSEQNGNWGYYDRGDWIQAAPPASQQMSPQVIPAPPPIYQQPHYVAPVVFAHPYPPVPQDNPYAGLATSSLVLGIVGLVFSILPLFLSWCSLPVTIIGAILGGVGLRSTTRRGQAIAGLVTSVIGILKAILWTLIFAGLLAGTPTR